MDTKNHFILGLVLSLILMPFFGFYSFFALIPSVLLDLDHYLLYIIKTRQLSFKKAVEYHRKGGCGRHHLCIFHTVEFLLLLGILSISSKIMMVVFIGTIVHLFVDYLDWFLWFSYYSERIPSIILAQFVLKRAKFFNKKLDRLGRKCIVCGFDKAWDSHFIFGVRSKEVMLCPNHHYMVHNGFVSDEDLLNILENRKQNGK